MKNSFETVAPIDRAIIRQLLVPQDKKSLVKLSLHLGIFIGLTFLLGSFDLPIVLLVPVLLFYGFVIFSLYAPFHECTHESAFQAKPLNRFGAWITGYIYGYSPGIHKAFHFAHHRLTNEEGDPEKGFQLPPMPGRIFFQLLLLGFLGMLPPIHSLILSVAPVGWWDKLGAPWAPAGLRKKLAGESRIIVLLWAITFVLLSFHITLMIYLLVGVFIGRFIHGIVSLTEHEGLGADQHMLYRSRSVISNPVFRWFWWNMNFHSEHHNWPAVPWHNLPTLHEFAQDQQIITYPTYVDVFLKEDFK